MGKATKLKKVCRKTTMKMFLKKMGFSWVTMMIFVVSVTRVHSTFDVTAHVQGQQNEWFKKMLGVADEEADVDAKKEPEPIIYNQKCDGGCDVMLESKSKDFSNCFRLYFPSKTPEKCLTDHTYHMKLCETCYDRLKQEKEEKKNEKRRAAIKAEDDEREQI